MNYSFYQRAQSGSFNAGLETGAVVVVLLVVEGAGSAAGAGGG